MEQVQNLSLTKFGYDEVVEQFKATIMPQPEDILPANQSNGMIHKVCELSELDQEDECFVPFSSLFAKLRHRPEDMPVLRKTGRPVGNLHFPPLG